MNLQERVFDYSLKIIRFVAKLPNKRLYWSMSDQLLRSATSIGANIIEAQGACSRRDFINFYHYSLKSSKETIYWLKLLKNIGTLKSDYFDILIKEAEELTKIIAVCILRLKGRR